MHSILLLYSMILVLISYNINGGIMRVFLDNEGRFYKAEEAADKSHAERPVITADFLQALPDDGSPMFSVDIDDAVQKINAGKEYQKSGNIDVVQPVVKGEKANEGDV